MKKLLALLLALVMVLGLVACGAADEPAADAPAADAPAADAPAADAPADAPAADKTYKFGLMMYAETDEAAISIRTGVVKACEEAGVELIIGSNQGDHTKTAAVLETILAQDIDALIDATWPAEVGLNTSAICKERGIPLVTCDVEYDDYAHLVGANNYGAGEVNGEYAINWINENWGGEVNHVIAMYPYSGGDGVKARILGCTDMMVEQGLITEDQIIWFDASNTEVAMATVRNWLTGNPEADKIFILNNNDSGGLGSYQAVQTMGREDDVMLLSYNADSFALEHFAMTEDSCWKGTCNFNLAGYGDLAVPALLEILETGEDNIAHELNTKTFVIDRANVADYYKG